MLLPDSENELAALDESEKETANKIELVLRQAEAEELEAQSEITLK